MPGKTGRGRSTAGRGSDHKNPRQHRGIGKPKGKEDCPGCLYDNAPKNLQGVMFEPAEHTCELKDQQK